MSQAHRLCVRIADQAIGNMEVQHTLSLANAPATLSIKTARIGVRGVRTPSGATVNRITNVAVKVTIRRQD